MKKYSRAVVVMLKEHPFELFNICMQKMKTDEKKLVDFKIKVVWYVILILEMFLLLRFFMKLIGANVEAFLSKFVYGLTEIFVFPFRPVVENFEFGGIVLEPMTILAVIFYWMAGLGVVKFMALMKESENIFGLDGKDKKKDAGKANKIETSAKSSEL